MDITWREGGEGRRTCSVIRSWSRGSIDRVCRNDQTGKKNQQPSQQRCLVVDHPAIHSDPPSFSFSFTKRTRLYQGLWYFLACTNGPVNILISPVQIFDISLFSVFYFIVRSLKVFSMEESFHPFGLSRSSIVIKTIEIAILAQ